MKIVGLKVEVLPTACVMLRFVLVYCSALSYPGSKILAQLKSFKNITSIFTANSSIND